MILSASRLILFSFHPKFYAIPHPKPAGTIMVTEDIPVGPLMMSRFGPISVLHVLPYSRSPHNLL
jgi:hypothetical protein